MPQIGCIVCNHVAADVQNANFVVHTGEVWAAGCSENCLDNCSEADLAMIHLGHLANVSNIPKDFMALPINFSIKRVHEYWSINYFSDAYLPEEGDFIAAAEDSPFRNLDGGEKFYAYSLPDGELIILVLDEGTRCIPFWSSKMDAEKFANHLDGTEKLRRIAAAEIMSFAARQNVDFLAADFLSKKYDLALLAKDF